MNEGKRCKMHSAELKAKAGPEALRGLQAANEIGQQCGLHPVLCGSGIKKFRSG